MIGRRKLGRRRILAVLAAAGGLPLWPSRLGAVPTWSWDGYALGTAARIQLCHPDQGRARELVEGCVAELRRLEAAFSLYRQDSELSRLNRDGFVDHPSRDFVALMRLAQEWGGHTGGAFDATVQPVWRLYADHFARHPDDRSGPSAAAIDLTCSRVDYRAVDITVSRIAFGKPGMAATLNGIAQGFITDRIVERLRDSGIDSTLIEMGEIAGLGLRGDGSDWTIAVPNAPGAVGITLPLRDQAIATSAGFATSFEPSRRFHHLFVPRRGVCANHVKAVSVVATTATAADALSTALFVAPAAETAPLLRRARAVAGAVEAIVLRLDGSMDCLTQANSPVLSDLVKTWKGAMS
jgi:thiamine biosynthesis lipoprotein